MAAYDYDVVVIGGGPAGLAAAKAGAIAGKKVAIIEKEHLGGQCVWVGCIPSKTLINIAAMAHAAKQAHACGASGSLSFDTHTVMDYIRATIKSVYQSQVLDTIKQHENITIIQGHALFLDAHHITVGHEKIRFDKAIIATGSAPAIPEIDGLSSVAYLTNQTIFDLPQLPASMIILGAGAIGVELACAYNRLGVKVTLITRSNIMPKEDRQLSDMLATSMIDEGVIIATNMNTTHVMQHEHGIRLIATDSAGGQHEFNAQKIVIATGRTPNVYQLGLENAGIHFDEHGLKVDAYLATTQKNIYACGDIVGPCQLSHMALYQANIAMHNAFSRIAHRVDDAQAIWVTYSAPEFAAFGLTEDKAHQWYNGDVSVYRALYSEIDRAHTDQTLMGMAKVICDSKGYIIGTHILGARAGEIIHELHLARLKKIKLADLDIVRAYPTYSQLINRLAKKAYNNQKSTHFVGSLIKKIMGQ